MGQTWQLQEAKNRFSEVVDEALTEGPQVVTRRGEEVVVIVSMATWRQVSPTRPRLKDALRSVCWEDAPTEHERGERADVELP